MLHDCELPGSWDDDEEEEDGRWLSTHEVFARAVRLATPGGGLGGFRDPLASSREETDDDSPFAESPFAESPFAESPYAESPYDDDRHGGDDGDALAKEAWETLEEIFGPLLDDD